MVLLITEWRSCWNEDIVTCKKARQNLMKADWDCFEIEKFQKRFIYMYENYDDVCCPECGEYLGKDVLKCPSCGYFKGDVAPQFCEHSLSSYPACFG